MRILILVAAGAAALVAVAGCAPSGPGAAVTVSGLPAATAGLAGSAIEVPGTAALDKGADASVLSVSCASAGNCSAGGYYSHRPGAVADFGILPDLPQGYEVAGAQAFVASQVHGTWRPAVRIRFPAALRAVGGWVQQVSCRAPGDCSAGGTYADRSDHRRAFVAGETGGKWGTARPISGTSAFRNVSVSVMSCASAGNCAAGGAYEDAASHRRMFVVSEVHGRWGTARLIKSIVATHSFTFQLTGLNAMSCGSPGNCTAGGEFQVPDPASPAVYRAQTLVISEVRGKWGAPAEVPGTAALNGGGKAQVTALSCRPAGNCTAGGTYWASDGQQRAFVVTQVHGKWGTAIQAPGVAAIMNESAGLSAALISSVSCPSAGNCTAGGFAGLRAFVLSQVNGHWRPAQVLSGAATLSQARLDILTVACGSPGTCSAAGHYSVSYSVSAGGAGLFVAREVSGRWGAARAVPGTPVLRRHPNSSIVPMACDQAGNCSGGGNYPDGKSAPVPHGDDPHLQALVVSVRQ